MKINTDKRNSFTDDKKLRFNMASFDRQTIITFFDFVDIFDWFFCIFYFYIFFRENESTQLMITFMLLIICL